MCARQHAVAEVACYRLKTTLVGCVDSPTALRGGSARPLSAIEFTKDEAGESIINKVFCVARTHSICQPRVEARESESRGR